MKRIWGHAVSLLVLGLVASATVPACVDNDRSIFIRSLMFPATNRQNGACLYQLDPNQPGQFYGTLDVGLRDNYVAVLLVGNQMIARADPLMATTESNRIHLNGIISRITDLDGNDIREFTQPATGFADVGSAGTPGYGLIGATVVDKIAADSLAASIPRGGLRTLVINVKAYGKTLGGVDVESGEFQFPLRVCNGCLVDFSSGNDPNIQPQPNCERALTTGGATTTQLPCFEGQDEAVPCQLCKELAACNPLIP